MADYALKNGYDIYACYCPIFPTVKIEHIIIPELKSINSNAEDAFSRFSESVRDDAEFLENLSHDAFKQAEIDKNTYSVEILGSFHKSIKNGIF